MGKVLRVDLSSSRIKEDPLPSEEILRKYIGGTGLGLYFLMKETPENAKPLGADVPLIFMTGPLTGTTAPSSSNFVILSLNYQTPYAAATGHSHGFWGAYLKFAGFDAVIFNGASKNPVFL